VQTKSVTHLPSLLLASLLFLCAPYQLQGKDKSKQTPASSKQILQDQISVDAHLVVPGGPVTRFVATHHYDRSNVYAEHGPGQPLTLLDISNPAKPLVVSQLQTPAEIANLVMVGGTASHELRTPLAAIRAIGEVGLERTETPREYRELVGSMLEEVNRLTRLVDDLLVISRSTRA
jgi:hypothetical protein